MRRQSNPRNSLQWGLACCLAGMSACAAAQTAFKLAEVPLNTDVRDPKWTGASAVNRFGWTAANDGAANRCSKTECQHIPLNDCFRNGKSAADINDAGIVVGSNPYNAEGCRYRAYSFDGTTVKDLGAFKEGFCDGCLLGSGASAINNLGQVVGYGETADGAYRGALWKDGEMQKLGTLGGVLSEATAINDVGIVAGNATLADGLWHAFRYRSGKMEDLGTLGGSQSFAKGVNHARQVVGCSQEAGNAHLVAFMFDDGPMAPLRGLEGTESCAYAINNRGWVVGSFRSAADDADHAFLFDGTTMIDLNDTLSAADRAQWLVTAGYGINKQGQIAGAGMRKVYGNTRALLLTPRDPR